MFQFFMSKMYEEPNSKRFSFRGNHCTRANLWRVQGLSALADFSWRNVTFLYGLKMTLFHDSLLIGQYSVEPTVRTVHVLGMFLSNK